MNVRTVRADILLFLTAAIWGLAFVAQRVGMDHVGPLTFNGVRFALGALALLPLIRFMNKGELRSAATPASRLLWGGLLLGLALFGGSTLQQLGLAAPLLDSWGVEPSTAGKAGFITGLYVVLVPIMGLAVRQRTGIGTWSGAALAVAGMYLLSVTGDLTIAFGDMLVLGSALFWAGHVLIIGWLSPGMNAVDAVRLSSVQFAVCAALSLGVAIFTEDIALASILDAGIPILYGGIMSVGVAYTLQVVAQRDANPSHAAVILSLESVFAALGGWMMLDETLGMRALIGCALMLAGMLLSQLRP
ncbi:DMT family transporter [Pseudodesulfovibrio senegalensis]|jgi:drug/metabolite transporter (DMT)-like permease|uniref:DMT family transporter n=1 Tax=Pseudodesulfovibrio senegalensis TaxID=1721087 RepID=A0A6N6MYJ9_9BACT|nr:DMT family transporter [Pseudodesulfovibrio senegalensis]KAB1439108.1 DMT family transporter [Pseudodesulfovibrio senegalensis]